MKIKIFQGSIEAVETQINQWVIEDKPDIKSMVQSQSTPNSPFMRPTIPGKSAFVDSTIVTITVLYDTV